MISSSAELYDPASGTWSVTGNLITPRSFHTATLLPNGKVLVAGGYIGTAPSIVFTNSAELYDLNTGTWTSTGNLNTARTDHTATLLPNGKVLIAGGWIGTSAAKSAELYDPETGRWSTTGSLVAGRYGQRATLLQNGQVLLSGGSDDGDLGTALVSAELYEPDTGIWRATGRLTVACIFHTSTLLFDGRVLVAGGYSPTTSLNNAEIYDPITGNWTATSKLNTARQGHTATLLPDGRVMVAGGATGTGAAGTIESWDPATGKWSDMASMTITPRRFHTATRLLGGRVLIAGGVDSTSLSTAELLDAGLAPSLAGGVGTRLLIPSSVYSDEFVSSLVVLNIDSEPNDVTIQTSNHLGDIVGSMSLTLQVGERFRATNILQGLGAAPGSSGPILVSSSNGRLLSAVSEVISRKGGGGTFKAVNLEPAWTQGFVLEVADSGLRGVPGTYRTNLGLINSSATSATNVTMTLFSSSGQQVGNPLTVPLGIDCRTVCLEQINAIVQSLRGSALATEGYVGISSTQPIIAWASKIENGTDDPSFQVGVGAASSGSQESRYDVGTRLLIPSAAHSDVFTSTLVVLNMDSQPNSVTITAYDTGGNPVAPPFTTTIPVRGQFRSSNVLQQLGAAFGSFGPIMVESASNRLLSVVSEVKSPHGFSGFFPGVNIEAAWTQGFILEAMDSGQRGTAGTYRTNLGLNGLGPGPTNASITLFNDSGQQVGNSISTTVVAHGLTQLNNIVDRLRGSEAVSGGYLRIVSSQPILAWAAKVQNETDDPNIQLAIGVP